MEASPEFYGYFDATHNGNNNCNHFMVDELLDFSKEDDVMTDAFFDSLTGGGNSADSSSLTAVDSCNSSSVSGGDNTTTTTTASHFNGSLSCRSFTDAHFSGTELCVPYDDLAELEWLSNFMEDSVSSDEALQGLQFIPTGKAPSTASTDSSSSSITTADRGNNRPTANSPPPIFPSDVSVPGKARSKRSRAAPCDWSSRLLVLSPATSSSENDDTNPTPITQMANNNNSYTNNSKPVKTTASRRRECTETQGRRCLHCGSEKTPQWRTGPMGPKTLCNACGVRYKSGRLVPEYRPAASPTFVSSKHSNSHRKVLELRRQKDLQRQQEATHQLLGQTSIFGLPNGADDYLIHHQQQIHGPDYSRHMV